MDFILDLILKTAGQVWLTFLHNWPYLLLSVALATLLKLYLDTGRVAAFLLRYQKAGVVGATAVAVTTPLCSCGTTAIVLGMIANLLPWAPIVAFMVASPLTSPQELVYSAGLFGWRFALAFFAASIFLGLLGGAIASVFDRRGWLVNQVRQPAFPGANRKSVEPVRRLQPSARSQEIQVPAPSHFVLEPAGCGCQAGEGVRLLSPQPTGLSFEPVEIVHPAPLNEPACGCSGNSPALPAGDTACGCPADEPAPSRPVSLRLFVEEMFTTGKRLLVMFLGFAFIGYFLNGLIPAAWVASIFGHGNAFSVPLAAILGLPLYVNTEASLPLVKAMLDAGMSQGAALAFLITGAGTSFGAVAGMLTIARSRVVSLVIGTLLVGAALFGMLYNLLY